MKMDLLGAVTLAARLHDGQTDKAGEPYIGHCVRVMLRVKALCAWSDCVLVAALLHDAVEDGRATMADLTEAGVSPVSLQLIDALTKRKGEEYAAYLGRVRGWDAATDIKLADIADNSAEGRLALLPALEAGRLREKYRAARAALCAAAELAKEPS